MAATIKIPRKHYDILLAEVAETVHASYLPTMRDVLALSPKDSPVVEVAATGRIAGIYFAFESFGAFINE